MSREFAVTRRPHGAEPGTYGWHEAWCDAHGGAAEAVAHVVDEVTLCRECLLEALAALDAEAAT